MKKLNLQVILTTLFVFCSVMVWGQNTTTVWGDECKIFLQFQNADGEKVLYNPDVEPMNLTRQDIESAEIVAKCGDETLEIMHYTVAISDGQGGFVSYDVKGSKFAYFTEIYSAPIPSGRKFLLEKINVITADKGRVLVAFPPLEMP